MYLKAIGIRYNIVLIKNKLTIDLIDHFRLLGLNNMQLFEVKYYDLWVRYMYLLSLNPGALYRFGDKFEFSKLTVIFRFVS